MNTAPYQSPSEQSLRAACEHAGIVFEFAFVRVVGKDGKVRNRRQTGRARERAKVHAWIRSNWGWSYPELASASGMAHSSVVEGMRLYGLYTPDREPIKDPSSPPDLFLEQACRTLAIDPHIVGEHTPARHRPDIRKLWAFLYLYHGWAKRKIATRTNVDNTAVRYYFKNLSEADREALLRHFVKCLDPKASIAPVQTVERAEPSPQSEPSPEPAAERDAQQPLEAKPSAPRIPAIALDYLNVEQMAEALNVPVDEIESELSQLGRRARNQRGQPYAYGRSIVRHIAKRLGANYPDHYVPKSAVKIVNAKAIYASVKEAPLPRDGEYADEIDQPEESPSTKPHRRTA